MKIVIVSDAWAPQVNGVVRTLQATVAALRAGGHDVETMTPDQFRTVPCPGYREIRLAVAAGRAVARRLDASGPASVHIATEGPLGWAARRWCLRRRHPFTTSFHTRFADYAALRTGLSPKLFWPALRRFHRPARRVMVATRRLADELHAQGLPRTHLWSRGVDLAAFAPRTDAPDGVAAPPRPVQLYVGRLAVEKNVAAFLATDVPGTKLVVGDGPAHAALAARYPRATFLGRLDGAALRDAYRQADVLVFPSRTDTFGLVIIEALASGVPVAAYPVAGPLDILGPDGRGRGQDKGEGEGGGGGTPIGALDDDLATATRRALAADRAACVAEGRGYSWEACTRQFIAGLAGPVAADRAMPAVPADG